MDTGLPFAHDYLLTEPDIYADVATFVDSSTRPIHVN